MAKDDEAGAVRLRAATLFVDCEECDEGVIEDVRNRPLSRRDGAKVAASHRYWHKHNGTRGYKWGKYVQRPNAERRWFD